MTPYELNLHIMDYAERTKQESQERLALAYLTAYWQRVKRMPDLKKLIEEPKKPKKPQTDEDMLAEANKLFGQ